MANETEIAPALTAAEWLERNARRNGAQVVAPSAHGTVWARNIVERSAWTTLPAESIPALMALANAALPDEDQRKFTHADVDELNWLANTLADALPGVDEPSAAAECLRSIAAGIAALLPPHP